MKTFKKYLLILMTSTILITQSGCFGSFEMTKAVYEFNQGVGDKVVNEVVFLALIILPVYELAAFVDVIIFNSIEFWTGTNPIAMNEGDIEIQEIENGGKLYQITATKNKFNVKQLEGPNAGEFVDLVYNPDTQIWRMQNEEVNVDFLKVLNENEVKVFKPFKSHSIINLNTLRSNTPILKNV